MTALTGSFAQWALFGTVVTAFFTALGLWIKHGPDRGRVANERKAIDLGEMEKVIAGYTTQLKEFRDEVHALRNELHAVKGELLASDRVGDQRSNWISDMMYIIELLIAELEKIDPLSPTVKQAKAMLKRMGAKGSDGSKSEALEAAETSARDARQSARSAEHTVDEIELNEAKGGGGK